MKWLGRWLPIGLLLTLGLLLGSLGFSIWEKIPTPVQPVAWSPQAQWIAFPSPSYRFYARQTFSLADSVEAGWLRLSADNDFTLYVNGRRIATENSVLKNGLGLNPTARMPFQYVNDSNFYNAKTSINYLLASSQDWKLTVYIDLTSYLRPGKNVIALEIQKGQQNPRMVVEGAVYPVANANPINLTTGLADWRVSNLSETRQSLQWFDRDFSDESWSAAKTLGSVQEVTYSRLSKNLFDLPLKGNFLTGTLSPQGQLWLRSLWQIPQDKISHAYIRFTGQENYSVLLNGNLVNHYRQEDGKQLHLLEVTKFLHPGNNILAVSLVSPLDTTNSHGLLNFFLDGWAETEKGEMIRAIATNNSWTTVNQPVPGWTEGIGHGKPVNLLDLPKPQEFRRSFEGNAYLLNYPNYLWHQSIWQLGAIACAFFYASILGYWLQRADSFWDSLAKGAAILTPSTLFLIAIGLLKHRYAEAEFGLIFAQAESNSLILVIFSIIVLLTLIFIQGKTLLANLPHWSLWFFLGVAVFVGLGLVSGENIFPILLVAAAIIPFSFFWKKRNWQLQDIYRVLQPIWISWGQWFLFLLIVIGGYGLRIYNLGFIDLDSDENTSLDATRGILHTGSPIVTSGVFYSRGPFYHYLLALWLRIVGDSIVNARLLSVLVGTATLILIYFFTRQVTGKVAIALLVIAILALNPWELWYSRNIRFYQVLQFMTILSFWTFFKGFIDDNKRLYQYLFFIALTLTLLTQEISLTLLPTFFIGFLCFYRPFRLSKDWPIILASLMTMIIFIFCLGFSAIRILTPLAALADNTASYIRLHVFDVTELIANVFIGPDRIQTIYTFCFFIGFIYFLKLRDGRLIFLFSSILIQILLVTILSYQLEERYIYGVYPLFICLAIYSLISVTQFISRIGQSLLQELLPLPTIALSLVMIMLVINIQPNRVLASYNEAINRRNSQIFEYIKTHKQPADVVISPTPSFAAINLGGLDYFFMGTGYFDAVYWREGRLIDRWGGGLVISTIDQLNNALQKHQRVWIHIDDIRREKFDSQIWQYMETLGKPMIDLFGTRLRLWTREDGLPSRIPNQGKDLGAY